MTDVAYSARTNRVNYNGYMGGVGGIRNRWVGGRIALLRLTFCVLGGCIIYLPSLLSLSFSFRRWPLMVLESGPYSLHFRQLPDYHSLAQTITETITAITRPVSTWHFPPDLFSRPFDLEGGRDSSYRNHVSKSL